MALNVQTAGDEAIYVKFPGASGIPTPASGRTVANLVSGMLECRKIYRGDVTKVVNGQVKIDDTKATDDKVIWAHKWRLNLSGENCTFAMTSNDPKFTRSGNVGRCKDAKTITVEVQTDTAAGRIFDKWADGSTENPRTFVMTQHLNKEAQTLLGFEVTIKALSNSGVIYHGFVASGTELNLQNLQVDAGNKAVLDTLEDFTVSYNDSNHVNLKNSGFRGWTLDVLRGSMGGNDVRIDVTKPIIITGTTVVVCSWTKQIRNKYIRTSKAINKPDLSQNFFLFQIAGAGEVALPVGGRLYVSDAYGILTHMGNSTSHSMCIFASVNDIAAVDNANYSNPDAFSSTKHNETSWKLPQKLDFGSYSAMKDENGSTSITIGTLPSAGSSSYKDGKGWDIIVSNKFRPYAPRVVPFTFDEWRGYIKGSPQFEPTVTTTTTLNAYKEEHAVDYENWSTLRTMFLMRDTVLSTGEDYDGNPKNFTLPDHMAMINAGTYEEITNGNTVLTDDMNLYIDDNFGHSKEFVYILDCCSVDFTRTIPAGEIGKTFYDYFNNSGYVFPGYNHKICINDPEDPESIKVIWEDNYDNPDTTSKFEAYQVYYLRFTDPDTDEEVTYYIPISNSGAADYVYPIYEGETLNEYKARVAGYTNRSVAETGIKLYRQETSASSPDAIYVSKSTGESTTGVLVHAQQTSGGLSIPEKLGSGNRPTGLHLTMLKSNSGCTVSWKFFLYSLKINLY